MHKVAIISREFYPHTNFGGMATFYENLSESLINHGVHVEIFTQGVANKMITMNNGIIINYVTLNKIFGRSEFMTSVIFNGKKSDIGKILPVKIFKSNRSTLFGELVDNFNQKVA